MKKIYFFIIIICCFMINACSLLENQPITLEEYVESIQPDIDKVAVDLKSKDVILKVYVKDESLIYSYQYETNIADMESVKLELEQLMEKRRDEFESLSKTLKSKVKNAKSIIVENLDKDGNLICSEEF